MMGTPVIANKVKQSQSFNRTPIILFIMAVIVLSNSCNKNDTCSCKGEIYGKWEVLMFLSVESRRYPKDNNYQPTIEFRKDGSFSVSLDVNKCFGEFELVGKSEINTSGAGCTKMCCDSDFSNKFVQMLPQISSYEIEDDKLKLNVPEWGWIELKYISD